MAYPSSTQEQEQALLKCLITHSDPSISNLTFFPNNTSSNTTMLHSFIRNLRSSWLCSVPWGAGECWHKHGSFFDHLVDMYRILKLWKTHDSVCLLGLFHSAYSNSYVNLAIFDPHTGRDVVCHHVGAPAERLIHPFCVVPRHSIIHDDLLFRYTDVELLAHLHLPDGDDAWRRKLCSVLPSRGITVKHFKTGEDVHLSRRVMAIFLLMTMAHFNGQLFGFQDALFDNSNGRLEFSGNNSAAALWPGNDKSGIWLNSISRMGALTHSLPGRRHYSSKRGNIAATETIIGFV